MSDSTDGGLEGGDRARGVANRRNISGDRSTPRAFDGWVRAFHAALRRKDEPMTRLPLPCPHYSAEDPTMASIRISFAELGP